MIKKHDDSIEIGLQPGVQFSIDLRNHKLDPEQHRILAKAAEALDGRTSELTAGGCPSKPYLEADEFERIKDLKATLTSTGGGSETDGLIADFCLKVVSV